jgi:methionyl-tRNA synthetase
MSKTIGNVVSTEDIVQKYGTDAFRYYFLRHIPSYSDGEFSWERLEEVYNNELANELGNAVSRTSAMIIKYQQGIIGDMPPSEHDIAAYEKAIEHCRFDRALETVWQQVRGLNQYIEEEKPWALAKNHDGDHLREVLAYMASCLIEIAELLEPFMPTTSQKIVHIFGTGVVQKIETTLFPKEESSVPTSEEVATA